MQKRCGTLQAQRLPKRYRSTATVLSLSIGLSDSGIVVASLPLHTKTTNPRQNLGKIGVRDPEFSLLTIRLTCCILTALHNMDTGRGGVHCYSALEIIG